MLMYISEEFKVVQFLRREKKNSPQGNRNVLKKPFLSGVRMIFQSVKWSLHDRKWPTNTVALLQKHTQTHWDQHTHSLTMSEWHGSRAATSWINNTSPAPPNLEETEKKEVSRDLKFYMDSFHTYNLLFVPLYLVSISLPFVVVHFQMNPSLLSVKLISHPEHSD